MDTGVRVAVRRSNVPPYSWNLQVVWSSGWLWYVTYVDVLPNTIGFYGRGSILLQLVSSIRHMFKASVSEHLGHR